MFDDMNSLLFQFFTLYLQLKFKIVILKEMFQPVIKWSGSKRSQANDIISYFPKEIATYYEPFCGGASILRALLDSDIKVHHYVASDLNKDLIDLFLAIKNTLRI